MLKVTIFYIFGTEKIGMKNDKKGKVLPNIDISVQKKDEEKTIIKYPSCRRNKLNFSKDLSDSLFSSRKNNSNVLLVSYI